MDGRMIKKYYVHNENEEEARIRSYGRSSTLLGFIKQYDPEGNLINEDPNIISEIYCNTTTNKDYTKISKGNMTKFYEGIQSYMSFNNEHTKPFKIEIEE